MSEFSKEVEYKFNIQQLITFLYINNEVSGETRKKFHFLQQQKKIKDLGINLTKDIKDYKRPVTEKYRTLKKEIEEDKNE